MVKRNSVSVILEADRLGQIDFSVKRSILSSRFALFALIFNADPNIINISIQMDPVLFNVESNFQWGAVKKYIRDYVAFGRLGKDATWTKLYFLWVICKQLQFTQFDTLRIQMIALDTEGYIYSVNSQRNHIYMLRLQSENENYDNAIEMELYSILRKQWLSALVAIQESRRWIYHLIIITLLEGSELQKVLIDINSCWGSKYSLNDEEA